MLVWFTREIQFDLCKISEGIQFRLGFGTFCGLDIFARPQVMDHGIPSVSSPPS